MDVGIMQDKRVSLTAISSAALWALGVVLVLLDLFVKMDTGDLGVMAAVGGATLSVRGYFVDLADRERNAFEIGRDSVRRTR